MNKLVNIYKLLLCKHPLLVQSVQTGMLMATGDVIAQKRIEKKCQLDYLRTVRFLVLGSLLVGPASTKWYSFLSRHVGDCGKFSVFRKVALDQLIFAPTFLAIFIIALNALQGKPIQCAKEQLCSKYKDILIANYKLWPAVQLINFSLMPLAYQVLFVQLVAIFWNTYLSWKMQHEEKKIKEE